MSFLSLQHLNLKYGKADAVKDLSLDIEEGQLISLLGPSGCGKTTTMRSVAGLLEPAKGRIVLGGQDITDRSPDKRDIGLVFQSYALFPHLTVFENVAFGLKLRRVAATERDGRVREALSSVGLEEFSARFPAQLSGGQQQRVALARAFVIRPKLLLLDEPLSNLDARLRLEMRSEIRRLQRELGITMLYVTHDQGEALSMSDRIVIMRAGHIEQDGPPEEVWSRPRTPFVAAFMGYENVFAYEGGALSSSAGRLAFPHPVPTGTGFLGWRPDSVQIGSGEYTGRVMARSYQGQQVEFLLSSAVGLIKGVAPPDAPWVEGQDVAFNLGPAGMVSLVDTAPGVKA
ncbi:ABC transporter ATP-binding protein [Deinococcus altitudinis]|uniref:ABC transporter ATP-binding protein n=1 Tax=Deinococcus altitudinis TaxID=468914 RepID=UPI003892284B